jgi:hypothetical protein
VRLIGGLERLDTFSAVGLRHGDPVSGSVVAIDLAPQEILAALEEIEHAIASPSRRACCLHACIAAPTPRTSSPIITARAVLNNFPSP